MPDQHPDENGRGTAVEVWRYEAPPGSWNYVTRDPSIIKRPGERGVWRSQAEDALLLDSLKRIANYPPTHEGYECLGMADVREIASAALDAWRPTDG